jgi:ABC-type sugar transport system permease subunit
MGYAIYSSLLDFRVGKPEPYPFIGLRNYVEVLTDPAFYDSIIVTSYFVVVTVPAIILISLGIALLLNYNFKGNLLLRTLLLIPWAMPGISVAALWNWIYDADYGVWNAILYYIGVIDSYHAWKSDPAWALPLLMIVHIWKFIPLSTILLLATLATIPKSLYEVAQIDGAGIFKRFRIVTLPMIKSTISFLVFLQIVYALLWHFVWVYVLTRGGPGYATTTLPWLTYVRAFSALDFGKGNALGVILAIIIAIFFPIFLRRTRLRERG